MTRYINSSSKILAIFWILGWSTSFTIAMALAKTLSPEVNSAMLVFMRCFFALLFFMPFLAREGWSGLKTKRPYLHILRVCFSCAAMGCTYYAYRHLEFAFAASIGFTGPLLTTILAMLVLKEDISWKKWLTIVGGYCGILVMVRPTVGPLNPAILIALLANFLAACSIISMKILTRTESTLTILFYTNIVMTALTGVVALFSWKFPPLRDMITLCLIGGAGTLSQLCYANALKHANPSFVSPFEYTRLIFAIPLGYFFFNEVPTLWALIGSLIIIASTLLLTRLEMREKTSKPAS